MALELLFGVLACVAYAAAAARLREHRRREGENQSGSMDVWMALSFSFLAGLYFARVLLVQFFPSFMEDYRPFVDLLWLLPSLVLVLTGLCKGRNPLKMARLFAFICLGVLLLPQVLQGFLPVPWAFIGGQILVMGSQGFWYYYMRMPPERIRAYSEALPELAVLAEVPQPFDGQSFEESSEGANVDEANEALDAFYMDLNDRLLKLFEEEKLYLVTNVNLREVATKMGTNKTYISVLLNKYMNQNFSQFVNAYRVREAQNYVKNHGRIALTKLCRSVGFHSMASFTVAFKLNTGMTPGEWCRQYKIAG